MQFVKRIFFFLLTNIAVLALLSVVMMVINHFFPGVLSRTGGMGPMLIYAFVIGFAGSIISLMISKWSAKRMYNIQLIDQTSAYQDPKLQIVWQTVERIAQKHGIKMPEVGYYEAPDANAFATGPSKNNSLVAVSTGLLNLMDAKEIEGVVGHEMAHVLNGDMVTLTLMQGVMNTFVIFLSNIAARIVASALSRGDSDQGIGFLTYNVVYMVFQMVFGLLAMLVIMWFSRIREYRADLGGAENTSKASMVAGLRRLQKMSELQASTPEEKKMAPFMINEPDSFFSTHPSLTNRIDALEQNYKLS